MWKRIYDKICRYFINNIINNKKLDNMDNIFVVPGLYIRKTTINSDHKDIIRVIGVDPKDENSWLTTDASNTIGNSYSSIPEYVILREFELVQVLEQYKTPKKLKFGDISSEPMINKSNEEKIFSEHENKSEKNNESTTHTNNEKTSEKQQSNIILPKEKTLEQQIIEKISKENKDKIQFNINIEAPSLIKLKNICDFLELNKETISKIYVKLISKDVLDCLYNLIKKELNNEKQISDIQNTKNLEVVDKKVSDEFTLLDEDKQQEKIDEIKIGIEDIDKFIESL